MIVLHSKHHDAFVVEDEKEKDTVIFSYLTESERTVLKAVLLGYSFEEIALYTMTKRPQAIEAIYEGIMDKFGLNVIAPFEGPKKEIKDENKMQE